MAEYYLAFKAFHIISIITWMASLFYLPRLFVYHAQQYDNADFKKVVEIQEQKLYYYIGYPAMVASLVSGVLLILSFDSIFKSGWFHAKLLFVALLFLFHFTCGFYRKKMLSSRYKSERFFRIFNELPTLLMIAIVILAVTKPF